MAHLDLRSKIPEKWSEWLDNIILDEIECVVADIAGVGRGKVMPANKFILDQELFLPASLFMQTITGEFAPIDWQGYHIENDVKLVPDYGSARPVPWAKDATLQIIHDVTTLDNKPVAYTPRNLLKKIIALYEKQGWRAVVAPEMEFFLTKPNTDPDIPIKPPVSRTGRNRIGNQAYSISGVDDYGIVIDEIYDFADAQGLEIDTIIQEAGAGQLEINLRHGNPLTLADQIFYFKRAIKEAALRHECYATFMAKPMESQPGSAMHIHQSVENIKTGKNIFSNSDGTDSEMFQHFIGGQQYYMNSIMCILAPYVNSYRRLTASGAAPVNTLWGYDNRTLGLRVPKSSPSAKRVENRIVGMDSNPYLAIAACLATGYLGMMKKILPQQSAFEGDAYKQARSLPHDINTALDYFIKNKDIKDILGEEFCLMYTAIKHHEISAFMRVISPWEREHLMLSV